MNSGNRLRGDIANLPRQNVKKTGDVHPEPLDELELAPHRPHRVNREDMQKTAPALTDPDQHGRQ